MCRMRRLWAPGILDSCIQPYNSVAKCLRKIVGGDEKLMIKFKWP